MGLDTEEIHVKVLAQIRGGAVTVLVFVGALTEHHVTLWTEAVPVKQASQVPPVLTHVQLTPMAQGASCSVSVRMGVDVTL